MRKDVVFGMLLLHCNVVHYVDYRVTLNRNGILNIRTAQDAAKHCDRLLASTHIFYLL